MNRLILYDTCNFRDYPVGGQVTSIRNFLRFLVENDPECCRNVLLAGVSCDQNEVGRIQTIETAGGRFSFLAVVHAETDLGNVKKSLRLEYMKGLLKYRRLIAPGREDVNYIHTPEAFAAASASFLAPSGRVGGSRSSRSPRPVRAWARREKS